MTDYTEQAAFAKYKEIARRCPDLKSWFAMTRKEKVDFWENADEIILKRKSELLWSAIERIERIQEEEAALAEDIKEVYAEAKGDGFDVKIIRQIVGIRKKGPEERAIAEALLVAHMQTLGIE